MSSTSTLTYTAVLGGASAAQVAALMASVPPPPDVLAFLGVRVISDSTPIASPVVRTLVLGLNPVASATATVSLVAGDVSGSPLNAVTVTAPGSGYIAPPIISFTGGRSKEAPQVFATDGPQRARQAFGIPQSEPQNVLAGSLNAPARAFAYLKLVSAAVAAAGSGYSASTFATVTGGHGPNGRDAKLTLTIVGGHITGVSIVDAGAGYTSVPTVTIVDPALTPGSGGSVTVSLGVDTITITQPGAGFTEAPTVVLTPLFQAYFPVGSDQAAPFKQLMTAALEAAVMSPVSAATPIIA